MSEIPIPKKITPDPIIDSVVEFRFSSPHQREKLVTLLFNHFSSEFPSFREFLPPVGFPSEYTTRVSLQNVDFTVNIGPNVLSFGCAKDYKGWLLFSKMVKTNMENLSNLGLIGDIERVGLRYINFFKNVMLVSQNINLDISFMGREGYKTRTTSLRTELQKGIFSFNVIVADNIVHNNVPGAILDVDVSAVVTGKFSSATMNIIERAHVEEKLIFYSLLKAEFLNTFKPEYD
jgi:uncharacterized protein (TIGR04255 family)